MNNSVERLWPAVESSRLKYSHHISVSAKAGQQIGDLQAELDDARQSLERANKKVNRLIGQKNQLSALLEKRDDEIDRLNREFGMQTPLQNASHTKEIERSGIVAILANAFSSAVEQAGVFFRQWYWMWQEPDKGRQAMAHGKSLGTHLIARRGGNAQHRIIGYVLFGLDKDEIERLLPIVERDCSSKGGKPLCLIDVDAFELLRGRGLIFEYLPPEKERNRFDMALDWRLYLQRRFAIIRRKWDPVHVVAFGPTAMNAATLWSSSPFESTHLPVVVSEADTIQ